MALIPPRTLNVKKSACYIIASGTSFQELSCTEQKLKVKQTWTNHGNEQQRGREQFWEFYCSRFSCCTFPFHANSSLRSKYFVPSPLLLLLRLLLLLFSSFSRFCWHCFSCFLKLLASVISLHAALGTSSSSSCSSSSSSSSYFPHHSFQKAVLVLAAVIDGKRLLLSPLMENDCRSMRQIIYTVAEANYLRMQCEPLRTHQNRVQIKHKSC